MDKKPLYELLLDKMEEKIPMVLSSDQSDQTEREIKELGEMLRYASDKMDKLRLLDRNRKMARNASVAGGYGSGMHIYLFDLEYSIIRQST